MKKNALFAAAIALSAALLPFVSCSDDEDESKLETVYAELPASVGENPLAGKTWKYTSDYSDVSYESWAFTNDTAVYKERWSGAGENVIYTSTSTYSYTYDAEKSLLFLGLKSYKFDSSDDSEDYEYSNVEELKEAYDKWYAEDLAEAKEKGQELTDEQKKALKASADSELADEILRFSLVDTKKFEIAENKAKFTDYFDGKLPTMCSFRYRPSDYDCYYSGNWLSWWFNGDSFYVDNFKMSDGKFSGDVTSSDWKTYTFKNYGTAKGTYELADVNSTEATITFTFTEIPDGVTAVSVNTPYKFKLRKDNTEYTLMTE